MELASPWIFLAVGLLLTLTPVPAIFPGKVKYRAIENLDIGRRNRSWSRVWRGILLIPTHWVELGRSYAGLRCLLHALEMLKPGRSSVGLPPAAAVAGIALGVGLLALVLMMAVFRGPEGILAPVAFVGGAIFAVMPGQVGLLALILAGASMIAYKSLAVFFAVLAFGLAGLGYLFGQVLVAGVFGAGFAATPLLLAFMLRRGLVIPLRQTLLKQGVSPPR